MKYCTICGKLIDLNVGYCVHTNIVCYGSMKKPCYKCGDPIHTERQSCGACKGFCEAKEIDNV